MIFKEFMSGHNKEEEFNKMKNENDKEKRNCCRFIKGYV